MNAEAFGDGRAVHVNGDALVPEWIRDRHDQELRAALGARLPRRPRWAVLVTRAAAADLRRLEPERRLLHRRVARGAATSGSERRPK
jgi:hypothetical protein